MSSPPALRKRERSATVAVEEVGAADEAGDEAVLRMVVELALRADLLDLAVAHDDEAVGHRQRLVLVVRHHDRGEAELALELADLDPHLLAQLRIEIGERLVEQQDVRLDDEGARQGDALLLAARELARQALAELFEPHHAQRLGDLALDRSRIELPHAQAEGDVLRHGEMREEGIALEDEAGIAVIGRDVGHVALAEQDAARRRLDEAGDEAQRRRLAAARGAEQDQELALVDLQRDILHRLVAAEFLAQILETQARHLQTT